MELGYSPNGEAFVARYEPGDMVMLHRSEPGALAQGQVGDWGKVVAVGAARPAHHPHRRLCPAEGRRAGDAVRHPRPPRPALHRPAGRR